MRTILYIVQKEFLQIFRNKGMMPIIFVMPFVQLFLLAHAATYEIKNIRLHWVDLDKSYISRELSEKFIASKYFELVETSEAVKIAENDLLSGKADFVLIIPPNFEKNLYKENETKVQLLVNAADASKAGVLQAYTLQILQKFNQGLRIEWLPAMQTKTPKPEQMQIAMHSSNWFNTELDYKTYMVPGVLVLLVTMIGGFLSAMNIVKEKEIGTIEQLNVTPIKKYQFIIGKLLPFWILGLFELILGTFLGILVFDIPFVGSPLLILGFAMVYLLVVLGLGLLISTLTQTQQQAMFLTWFFLVIFILMSGLFTPIESMPTWAQQLTRINPIAYFNEVMRMVMLKGSNFQDIQQKLFILIGYAFVLMSLALWRYKKTS